MATCRPPPAKKRASSPEPTTPPDEVDEVPISSNQLCFKAELALFKSPPIRQNCIREAEWVLTDPVSSLRQDAQLVDFLLPTSSDGCWDLSNMRLHAEIDIVDRNDKVVKQFSGLQIVVDEAGDVDTTLLPTEDYDPVAVVSPSLYMGNSENVFPCSLG